MRGGLKTDNLPGRNCFWAAVVAVIFDTLIDVLRIRVNINDF